MAAPQPNGEAPVEPSFSHEDDDVEAEIAAQRRNPELMRLLGERSKEPGKYTLNEVKKLLREG